MNLSIENVPGHVAERLRQLANRHGRPLQDELLAIIKMAVLDEWPNTTMGLAEEHQAGFDAPRQPNQLDEVVEQVRALPEERQQEVAHFLLAYLDEQRADVDLAPEQIEEIERRMAEDGPYATDEEVREVFARLTK